MVFQGARIDVVNVDNELAIDRAEEPEMKTLLQNEASKRVSRIYFIIEYSIDPQLNCCLEFERKCSLTLREFCCFRASMRTMYDSRNRSRCWKT